MSTATANSRDVDDSGVDEISLDLVALPHNVAIVRHAIGKFASRHGLTAQRLAAIQVCVSEAATNCVLHAYPTGTGSIRISARREEEPPRLVVDVEDRGCGMVPRTDSPGLGLGLSMIASLTDSIQMRARQDGGTSIQMAFELPVDATGGQAKAAGEA